jgi:hypothetical protein
MTIGILGWGSLLWECAPEFDRWHTDWAYDGPLLKIEFSRVSATRLGALTLVIDNEFGAPTVVAWCLSKRTKLEEAVCDLRTREGTTIDKIKCLPIIPNVSPPAPASVSDPIEAWARGKNLSAVIWTALTSNFRRETNQAFSVDAAVAYLKGLPPDAKVKAAEYIWRAPDFVTTPLRTRMQVPPWFTQG